MYTWKIHALIHEVQLEVRAPARPHGRAILATRRMLVKKINNAPLVCRRVKGGVR
jgi:hypothetical protein